MNHTTQERGKPPYRMKFDIGTIKHLGLQMYSTLPPVISELVANGWDANATRVEITIPEKPLTDESDIVIADNGIGMSDNDIREKYVITGRDRRNDEKSDETPAPFKRKVMGRKGIGKFSSFGIAREIEIESGNGAETSRLIMNYDKMLKTAPGGSSIDLPALPPTGSVQKGSRITLRKFTKFKNRRIPIDVLRKGLARRFSIIGQEHDFEVRVNGSPISPEERNLKSLLDADGDGNPYIWNYENEKIDADESWTVTGWIGALKRTDPNRDQVQRGISLMARGEASSRSVRI